MADMAEPGKETLEEATVKRKPGFELVHDGGDDRKKIKTDVCGSDPPLIEEKPGKDESEADGDNDVDDDDDDDFEEHEDCEHSNGKSATDAKGKGVVVEEDKGKGKLKVENVSDDESIDDGDLSGEDSDLSDDPLAEVDLENILPSRTRRRVSQPGAYIVNDLEDDDDSDDSDA